MPSTPFVVEDADTFDGAATFPDGRDQLVVAVKMTPVYGQLDLSLASRVVQEANDRGFELARETPYRDEYLLCVFEAYDDDDLDDDDDDDDDLDDLDDDRDLGDLD